MAHSVINLLPRGLRERLAGSPLLRKLVGNTSWLFADRALRMGVGLFVGVWVSRYLGPEQFGLYSYLIALVALLTPLANLGLDQILVRELVQTPARAERLLGTAFGLKLVGGGAVLLLSVLIVALLPPTEAGVTLLVALVAAGTIVQALDVADLWFQAETLARYTVYAKGGAFLLATLLRVGLILGQAPLAAFVWVALLEIVLGSALSLLAFRLKAMPSLSWRFDLGEARRLLAASWPLLFSGLAVMVYMKVDVVMLTQLRGERETGLYAAALRLSEVWYTIPMAIHASVAPAILAARQASEELYYRRLEQLTRLLVALAFVMALPIALLASPVVNVLYGPSFSAAAPVLAVHIWAALFVFMGIAQSPWDVAEDLTRLALGRTVGGAVVNVLLNLWLIPGLGALGAAIATAISYACSAWLFNLFHPRSRRVFVLQTRALNPFAMLARAIDLASPQAKDPSP